MWWVNFGWLSGAHQTGLSFLLLSKTGGESKMKKLMGQDKNREMAHHLLSQENETHLGED